MDMRKLSAAIELRRPLAGLSSLPFAIMGKDNQIKATWFNYYLDQENIDLKITIDTIFTMTDDFNVTEDKANVILDQKVESFDEPEIDEWEYASLLERQFKNFQAEEMLNLISKAEMQPLMVAYEFVFNYDKRR